MPRGEEANLKFLLILFLTLQHIQYSETCIKRTPYIKRTVAEVPRFIPLIFFKWNLYYASVNWNPGPPTPGT